MPAAPQEWFYSLVFNPSGQPLSTQGQAVFPYWGIWLTASDRKIILAVSWPWAPFIFSSNNTTVIGPRAPNCMLSGFGGQQVILTTGPAQFTTYGDVSAPAYFYSWLPYTFSGPGGTAYSNQLFILATENPFSINVTSDTGGNINGNPTYVMSGAPPQGGLTVVVFQSDQQLPISNWTATAASPASLSSFHFV